MTAQSSLNLKFEANTPRRVVDLKTEYTEVHVCGLSAGGTYSIGSGYISADDPCSFEIGLTKTSFSRHIMFVADESCETFWFRKTCDEDVSAYLSLICNSCVVKEKKDMPEQGVVTDVFAGDLLSLVKDNFIGGNCFDVSNVTFSGGASQLGTFSNGTGAMGIETGIILSSGNVNLAQGPNSSGGASANGGGGSSDPDLNGLTTQNLQDVAVLEFDFIPTTNVVNFDFVFGSEEYCEWVNSAYNDVFGFFISGPGITGSQNIALLPTGDAITINTVNNGTNSAYFIPNSGGCGGGGNNNIEYDGYTTVLTATANIPNTNCQVYHLRLAIADGSDSALDSGVFLKKGSFNAGSEFETIASDLISGTDETVEGCGDAFFRFTKLSDAKYDVVINFTISGTATSGVDYAALPTSVTIPASQNYVDLPVTIFADGIPEGLETIELEMEANICSCLNPKIILYIVEPDPIILESFDTLVCEGSSGSLVLDPNAVGGAPPLTYDWSNSSSLSTITVPSATGSYTVTVSDACGGSEETTWNVTEAPAPTVSVFGDGSICNGGFVDVNLSFTGTGPWTVDIYKDNVLWNTMTFLTPDVVFSVSEVGTYTVPGVSTSSCDGTGTGQAVITVASLQSTSIVSNELCAGEENGSIEVLPTNPGSYTYTWSPFQPDNPLIENLSPGLYELTLSDASGCTAVESYEIFAATPITVDSFSTEVNCLNPSDGTIDLAVSGGQPGYTYYWDNSATTASLYGLTAGTYAFTVTDANNCQVTGTETVEEGNGFPVAVIEPASVIDCNNPTISLSGNGSSTDAGTTYNWSTTDGNIVSGSSSLSPVIDMGGTYTLSVTNALGCVKDTSITISDDLIEPVASVAALGELDCDNPVMTLVDNGSSTGPDFSYLWTTGNGNIVSGSTSLMPVVDASGIYSLVVTNDVNGCTATIDVPVTGDTISPIADVVALGDLNCSNPSMSLVDNGSSTGSNFSYDWTTINGNIVSGNTSLTPLVNSSGTYTLVITNSTNGCTASVDVPVLGDTISPIASVTAPGDLDCSTSSLTLIDNGSSTGADFSYNWTTINGNIVSGNTMLTPVVNSSGTYTLVVTNDVNGCTATVDVPVVGDTISPVADVVALGELDCNNPTLTLVDNGSSSGSNFSYNWTTVDGNIVSGSTSLTPEVNASGSYSLVVTNDVNGCTASVDVPVVGDTISPVAMIGAGGVLSCIDTVLTLDGVGSSAGSDFTYSWTTTTGNILSGSTSLNPVINQVGAYQLVVLNTTNGCTSTQSVNITDNMAVAVVDAGAPVVIGCSQPTVALNGSITPNNASFEWVTTSGNIVSGENTLTPEVNAQGDYTLIVTHPTSGCTSENTVLVSLDQNVPISDAGMTQDLTCSLQSLNLDATNNTSQGTNYIYSWTTVDGNIVSGGATLDPEVNMQGTYQLMVTDTSNGCTSVSTVMVGLNDQAPIADVISVGQVDCNSNTATFVDNGSSTGSDFTYNWTTSNGNLVSGTTTLTPVIDQAGTYTLMVTDITNGCTATVDVPILADTLPPLAVATVNGEISCIDTVLTLSGTGSSIGTDYTYSWTTSNGNILSGETSLSPQVNQQGNYVLIVEDATNGCTNSQTVMVTQNMAVAVPDAGPSTTLGCTQTSVVLSGSITPSNASFEWVTLNGNIVGGATTLSPEVNSHGDYTLIATHPVSGCTSQNTVTVELDQNAPVANAGGGVDLTCNMPVTTLDGSSSSQGTNYSYSWSTIDGNIVSGATTLNPTVDTNGVYQLMVTDDDNGCTSLSSVTIGLNNQAPFVDAGLPATIDCNAPVVVLGPSTPSGNTNLTYSWTTTNGNFVSGTNTENPQVNADGLYELVVIDITNGCTSTEQVLIDEDLNYPTVGLTGDDEITCTAASATITAAATSSGPITYIWTTNDGFIQFGDGTDAITVNQAGTYVVDIVNTDNGCAVQDSFVVTTNADFPAAVAAAPNVLTCVLDTVDIFGAGSSSGSQFVYSWTTTDGNIISASNVLDVVVDQPGTYILGVTDITNNCASSFAVTVDENLDAPIVDAGMTQTLLCGVDSLQLLGSGNSNGSAIEYMWSTQNGSILSGNNTASPFVNASGTYYLNVTDGSNGCSALDSVVIDQDVNIPTVDAGPDVAINCQVSTVELGTSNTASGTNFTYQWTATNGGVLPSVSDTPFLTVADGGTYELLVTNTDNGCKAISVVDVDKNIELPIIDPGTPNELNCLVDTTLVGGLATSSGPEFSYSWSTPNGNIVAGSSASQASVNAPGDYILVVTNTDNFCESQMNVAVTEDVSPPSISIGNPSLITCTTPTVDLAANGSSTGNDFEYLWTTSSGNIISGSTTLNPKVNQPGFYTLLITNKLNGCMVIDSIEVDKDDSQPTALIEPVDNFTCEVLNITLDATASSSGNNYIYNWTTTNGNIVSGANGTNPLISLPGDYHLEVLDNSNNCVSFADITVDEDITPPVVEAGLNATIYCGDTTVTLDASGTDVGANFSYEWTTLDGNIVSGATTLSPTTNEVGTYYLAVENTVNGCQSMDSVVIVADVNAPVIVVSNSPDLTCDVLEIVINATNSSSGADFDYSWSTSNGNIVSGAKSNSPKVDAKGVYLLKLLNKLNGCETTKEVAIEQDIEEPEITGDVNDVLTCKLDEVDINSSATGSGTLFDFQWSTANGNIVSGDLSSTPKVNLKGTYTVLVKDLSNGCTSEKSFTVDENKLEPQLAFASPDDITCKQLSVALDASSSNDVAFSWTALSGNIVSGSNSANPIVNEKGDYQVVVTDNDNGCTTQKTVTVAEDVTKPVADAGDDLDIPCTSNSVQIGPIAVNPNYLYSWSTSTGNIVSGGNTANPIVSMVGSYFLVVEDKTNGCVQDDAVYVAAPSKVVDLAFDVEGAACNGAGGAVEITSVTGGTPPYLYSFDNGNTFSAMNAQLGLVSGSYKVVVQDVMGCEYEAYAIVPAAVLPVVETNSIYYIEAGDSAQLQVFTSILPDDIDTIIWNPIENLSCTNCLNPIAKPVISTDYRVLVMDKNGCDATARIAIFVSDPDIYIPNVFSPSSFNLENSSFYIHAKPNKVKEITTLFIVDRWGNLVFEQEHFAPNDPYTGWDGKFRDAELSPGVYVYHAVVEFVSGKKISYSGDVTIVK